MVVPSRELVNTFNFSIPQPTNNISNNSNIHQDPSSIDIEDHKSRGQSLEPNGSCQSSQFLGSRDSSMDYADKIETQNNLSWAEQFEEVEQSILPQANAPHVHNEADPFIQQQY